MAGWSSCFFWQVDSYLVNGLAAAMLASLLGKSLGQVAGCSLVLDEDMLAWDQFG